MTTETSTAQPFDRTQLEAIHSAAAAIAVQFGKYHGYAHSSYRDGLIEIQESSNNVRITLIAAQERVYEGTQYANDWEPSRFRPGAWVAYVLALGEQAEGARVDHELAEREQAARAFEPIDDAALFVGVTATPVSQDAPATKQTPSIGEQLETLLRQIARDEWETRGEF